MQWKFTSGTDLWLLGSNAELFKKKKQRTKKAALVWVYVQLESYIHKFEGLSDTTQ